MGNVHRSLPEGEVVEGAHRNESVQVYCGEVCHHSPLVGPHHSVAEGGCSPFPVHPHRGTGDCSPWVAGGPAGTLRAGRTRSAGHRGATVRCNEAHGCRSAGENQCCEALVPCSRRHHIRKAGGRIRGMAVCPGTAAGDYSS